MSRRLFGLLALCLMVGSSSGCCNSCCGPNLLGKLWNWKEYPCNGCGEFYWSEWFSDPPACCDPCNRCGHWVGPAAGAGCRQCGANSGGMYGDAMQDDVNQGSVGGEYEGPAEADSIEGSMIEPTMEGAPMGAEILEGDESQVKRAAALESRRRPAVRRAAHQQAAKRAVVKQQAPSRQIGKQAARAKSPPAKSDHVHAHGATAGKIRATQAISNKKLNAKQVVRRGPSAEARRVLQAAEHAESEQPGEAE